MKIAFVNPTGIDSYDGGAELWLKDVANSLGQKGNEIHIYVPSEQKKPVFYMDGEKIIPFRSRIFSFLKLIDKSNIYPLFLLPKLNDSYDLLYINTMSSILIPLFYRKNIVIGTHDCFSSPDRVDLKDTWRKLIPIYLYLFGSKRIKIHALDCHVASFFKNSKRKIFIIPPVRKDMAKRVGNNSEFNVVFLGGVSPRKGSTFLFEFLERIEIYSEINIIVVGAIDSKFEPRVKKYSNTKNVKFTRFVNEDQKNSILENGSVMVNFATRETFPGIYIEAMLSGLSIITTWTPIKKKYLSEHIKVVENGIGEMIQLVLDYYYKWKKNPKDFLTMKNKISLDASYYFDYFKLINLFQKEIEEFNYEE